MPLFLCSSLKVNWAIGLSIKDEDNSWDRRRRKQGPTRGPASRHEIYVRRETLEVEYDACRDANVALRVVCGSDNTSDVKPRHKVIHVEQTEGDMVREPVVRPSAERHGEGVERGAAAARDAA